MRPYYLSEDKKPCIWPVPNDCTWTGERYRINNRLLICAPKVFLKEAAIFVEMLECMSTFKASVTAGTTECAMVGLSKQGVDITLLQCNNEELGAEGYLLDAGDAGAVLQANTAEGVFHGLQTLLQLVVHAPDPSIHGVHITDKPLKSFRGICARWPDREDIPWFKRFIDFLARYKMNKIVLETDAAQQKSEACRGGGLEKSEIAELLDYIKSRHIEVIPKISRFEGLEEIIGLYKPRMVHGGYGDICPETCYEAQDGRYEGVVDAQMLAERICSLHAWLDEREIGMMMWSDKLSETKGSRQVCHNAAAGRNEILPATFEAVDRIPKDILLVDTLHGGEREDTGSQDYFLEHGFDQIFGNCSGPLRNWSDRIRRPNVRGAFASIEAKTNDNGMGAGENKLYVIIKLSCVLWWQNYESDPTSVGYLMPEFLERTIAQLYPADRDRLNQAAFPSRVGKGYKTIDLRNDYNAPLTRVYWRPDDYWFVHMVNATQLPNTPPFNLFQGVLDCKLQNAFCLAGNEWGGIYNIPVNSKARSLSFLHSYIFGIKEYQKGLECFSHEVVGHYLVHYADGTEERIPVEYGKNIWFWKNYFGENKGAYWADPVFAGVTDLNLPYVVYAQEWVNKRPDTLIEKVDIVSSENSDGWIALFGITAVEGQ